MKVTEFLGKKVLDKNALEIGKVSDMEIEPLEGAIKTITITKGELSLKQKTFMVTIDEVTKVGDYVIISVESDEAELNNESSEKEDSVTISLSKSD
ncbi:PRC-barrel domain-containing protein [Methanobacterium alcaliphilum]|uniref:PRC-barrel domain-containing protein n=1 Tax=Methanobacterium alcaliphilum TaxID=392018 RepID=UPI00200B94A4|nr:PRC-barrel domain-containing protein [Methanobacterium alcaliphilum]MCK9150883.1 PRC-barrel domain-containing protein [Methanobacterium alcaliphilum]